MTLPPRATSAFASREPTNPATPVTKTFIPPSLTRRQFFTTHTCCTLKPQTPDPKSEIAHANQKLLHPDPPDLRLLPRPGRASEKFRRRATGPARQGRNTHLPFQDPRLRPPRRRLHPSRLHEGIEKVLADPDTTNSKLKLFYLSTGDKDKTFDGIKSFHELLENRNIKHKWAIKSGTHEWKVWRESLYELAPLLFKQ